MFCVASLLSNFRHWPCLRLSHHSRCSRVPPHLQQPSKNSRHFDALCAYSINNIWCPIPLNSTTGFKVPIYAEIRICICIFPGTSAFITRLYCRLCGRPPGPLIDHLRVYFASLTVFTPPTFPQLIYSTIFNTFRALIFPACHKNC